MNEDMATELQDFRGKLTTETWCVLQAESRISGEDMQVILRDVMHAWASKKLNVARITDDLLRAKGLPGVAKGSDWKR